MRTISVLMFCCIEASAMGQGFNRRYDLLAKDVAQDGFGIELLEDGFLVLSSSSDYDSISADTFFSHASVVLTHLDADGHVVWEKRAYRPEHSAFAGWANCCDTIPGGGVVVGGSSEAIDGSDEVYLMRFNALGDTLWTRTFGDPALVHYWIGRQVRHTLDGGYAIVGSTDQNGSTDGFVIKTDELGNEQWRQVYGWSGQYADGLLAIDLAPDGGFFLSGSRFLLDTNGDYWLQRIDSEGQLVWRSSWGGLYSEGGTQVVVLSDGHLLVSSGSGYAENSILRPYLAKCDSADGSIIWEREYGSPEYGALFYAAKECQNNDLVACGGAYSDGDQHGILLRTTSEGDSLWMRSYFYQDTLMNDGEGRFWDVIPILDGGFAVSGVAYQSASQGYPAGYTQDTWVVKVDSVGCIVPGCDGVGVPTIITNMGDALSVYPNPAHDQLHVGIKLPANFKTEGSLVLSVTSPDGKLVRQQQVPTSLAGTVGIDVSSLAAGAYSVHLSDTARWIAGKKFIIE